MPLAQLFSVPSTVRPAGSAAVRIKGMAGGRALHRKRRIGGEAAGVGAGPHHLPAARGIPLGFDHRHAVRGLRLLHLLGAPGLHAVGVQQAVVGVFVVHHQQAAPAAVERVEVDAVMVHAHLQRLVGGAVGGVGPPGRHLAGHAHRLAPGREGLGHIAFRHHQGIAGAGRNRLEAELGRAAHRTGAAAQAGERGRAGQAQATAQHHAPRRVGHVVDARIGRAVGVFHRAEVLGHAGLLNRWSGGWRAAVPGVRQARGARTADGARRAAEPGHHARHVQRQAAGGDDALDHAARAVVRVGGDVGPRCRCARPARWRPAAPTPPRPPGAAPSRR